MAKVLCMEIGVSTIKIVEMDYMAKKPKVYRCIEVKTPGDVVKDGYLNTERIEVLKEAIKSALTEHKIRTKRVLFTVFSGKIISREIMLPNVKPHQIKAVIEANISNYFPIELDDYKVSYFHINTIREGENAGKHKVLVIAVEKVLLEHYDSLATELGLRIVDIDYMGNSVVQATRQGVGAGAVMVVKVEEENAIITILQHGTFILQRNINHALGGSLSSKEEIIESLVSTMMRVADFYLSHDENNKIEQIYVMGESSRDLQMSEMITKQMQIPCESLVMVRRVTLHKNAEAAPMNIFAAAIGAGISSVGLANEKEKERYETNYVSACILMIVFFVVLVIAIVSMALVPYNIALMEEKSLKKKAETYAPAKVVYEQYQSIANLYQYIDYGHLLTEHSNDAILSFLEELEKELPATVEMTEFSSNDDMCVMTMRVADKETAAGVISNLRSFSSLKSVRVESITEEEVLSEGAEAAEGKQNRKVYFTISCYYNAMKPVEPAAAK